MSLVYTAGGGGDAIKCPGSCIPNGRCEVASVGLT
jgi:hypothetical protein